MGDRNDRIVTTTTKSLDIVDIAKRLDGATISDIEQRTDMSQSTIYKHVNALLERGYLLKIEGKYKPGFELFHLGEHVKKSVQYYGPVRRTVERLREETTEQVEFGVESGGFIVAYMSSTDYNSELFYELTARENTEFDDYEGSKAYMHTNALGKALLAEKTDEKVRAIVDAHGLPKQAKNTITSIETLYSELDAIRRRGYATTDEEWDDGLREVGIAVKPTKDTVIGGFNVFGPLYQMDEEKFQNELPELLLDVASELEAEIDQRMDG
jgi:DNA-binding IclR family transcriptional regulator